MEQFGAQERPHFPVFPVDADRLISAHTGMGYPAKRCGTTRILGF
jgi:hypothetical protein